MKRFIPRKTIMLLTLVFFVSIFSCKVIHKDTSMKETAFIVLRQGAHCNVEQEENWIINNYQDYRELGGLLNINLDPQIGLPYVNFDTYQVVALFMGQKNMGGYTISIDHIESDVDTLKIWIKKTAPQGMATTVITLPYYIAKIKKTDKIIVFKE